MLATAAVLLVGAITWWWPAARGADTDVVVIGDRAVDQARDELLRRLRQEGMVADVVIMDAADCAGAESRIKDGVTVVLSFSDWSACPSSLRVSLLVQQPMGPEPAGAGADDGVRAAAPMFHRGDRVDCQWWDTPGAGESRPGLGQCESDGQVTVIADGVLTPAGRERFARLVVEALA